MVQVFGGEVLAWCLRGCATVEMRPTTADTQPTFHRCMYLPRWIDGSRKVLASKGYC